MEHKSLLLADCQLKFAETVGVFSGYGSIFRNVDSKLDIVMPGAYDAVLKSGDPVHVYVNHGWINGDLPVGVWSDLKQDDRGLIGDASLVMQMPSAIDAYWAAKSQLVSGLSVAFIPDQVENRSDGVRVIYSMKKLKEISIVTDPANDGTRIVSVKFRDALECASTEREIEKLLRDAGLSNWESKSIVSRAKAVFSGRDAAVDIEAKTMETVLDRLKKIAA